MLTHTIITDICSEDFSIPDCTVDLGELIDNSIETYGNLPMSRPERKAWRNKLNELITEYNERRQMTIYHFQK